MKKTAALIFALAMLGILIPEPAFQSTVKADTYSVQRWRSQEIPFTSTFGSTQQYFTGNASSFENGGTNGWTAFSGGTLSASATVRHGGSYSLKLAGRSHSWTSPTYNIYSILKAGGAGTYNISMWVYADTLPSSPGTGRLIIRGSAANQYSFFPTDQNWAPVSGTVATPANTWVQYKGSVTVSAADISASTGNFGLMIDTLDGASNQNLYIDDISIEAYPLTQLISGNNGNFENGTTNEWSAFSGGTLSASTTVKRSGSYALKLAGRPYAWSSPKYNIYNVLKAAGAGTYNISLWVYVDTLPSNPGTGRLVIRSDRAGQYSFLESGQSFGPISGNFSTSAGSWTQYSGSVKITEADIASDTGNFSLMIDTLGAVSNQNLYIDDVSITGHPLIQYLTGSNTGENGTFENGNISGFTAFGGGSISASAAVKHSGAYSIKLSGRSYSWYSPAVNIYNHVKRGGAGTYKISMWVYVDALPSSPKEGRILLRSDRAGQYSFLQSGQSFGAVSSNFSTSAGVWTKYYGSVNITDADISGGTGNFNLMVDVLDGMANQNLYIDDVNVYKTYSDPFSDVNLNVTFSGPGGTKIVMPGFWDGGTTWKVRFAPTVTGTWTYSTACSNTADTGLHNQTGTINCTEYTGNLPIYQKGFIKAGEGKRYFTHADGTPFFYIGDTHWSMPSEPYSSMFEPLVNKRKSQGFTVFQSEPIGASYNLSDGLTASDIAGFTDMDRRFKYIADAGLVHANAQLFFTDELVARRASYSTEYLQKLSRYWVARYASYPVLWTTAQESDETYYNNFTSAGNPWKIVFSAVHSYDPYDHPQSAHQENTDWTRASDSGFKNLPGYNWFAAQWVPAKNTVPDFNVAKDYWNNSGSRPAILYEGEYENLATNGFGARMQGWVAYLNGMSGYGYGAQDIWYTNTNLWEDSDYVSFGILVTLSMRQVLWSTSQNFAAATELGTHMKNFFNSMNWWQLTPRFNDTAYFANNGSYYSIASILNDSYVAYFYNTTANTGTLKGMDNVAHTAKWFNPRTGAYTTIGTNIVPSGGQWNIPSKPDGNDWVLYVYHS